MNLYSSALVDLINPIVLQQMQDRFAALGQVSVCICTTSGDLLTQPAWGSRFSKLVGTSNLGRKELADHLRRVVCDPKLPGPATCLRGMDLYAAPILHDQDSLGVIVVGTRAPTWPPDETIRGIAAEYQIDGDDLIQATRELEANIGGTPRAAHRFADGLAGTIATLYAQAERIQRQLTDLRTVHELADMLSGTFDLQEILNVTVNRVVKVLPLKGCGIRLLDERTGELVIKAVCNLSEEYLQKGPVVLRNSPIDGAAFAGETVYIENAPDDPRIRYPENARREGLVSGLCVPMAHRGKTVGVIRVYTGKRYAFSESEKDLLRSIGSQAAAAIISQQLLEEHAESERVQRQMHAAGQIQRRMLPANRPNHPNLSFGCVYVPTLKVGGDFYDFIELHDGSLGVAIADIAGKGLPAALMMASVRAALRNCAHDEPDLAQVMSQVNRHLCRDTLPGEFATLVYGVFSPNGSSFQYCNAGHSPPMLLRGVQIEDLPAGGLIIGFRQDAEFEVRTIALQPGDLLVMTTDGITEAMNFQGEIYGRSRLVDSILRHRGLSAEHLARQILWDVRRFVGLAEQSDDITVVVIQSHFPNAELA